MAHCAAAFSQHRGLFATFFLGGLTGGFTHCLSMCGPMVASETMACRSACAVSCNKRTQVKNAFGLMYHLGRGTTYGALGFFAACLSRQIATFAFWPWVSSFMLFVAGAMFMASSLQACHHAFPFKASGKLTYVRGLLLGFMPCGLLYAALMMASTLADPVMGMLAMWVFTLGTIPALLIASGGSHLLSARWQRAMQAVGHAAMAFNGISLLVLATKIMR